MHSSASSGSDEMEMFPEEQNRPATPQTRNRMGGIADAELSPPDSQERTTQSSRMPGQSLDTGVTGATPWNANSTSLTDTSQGQTGVEIGTGFPKEEAREPGWQWKTPKAEDDYEKSENTILDKGFSLSVFG